MRLEAQVGVAGRTLAGSVPDWNLIGHAPPQPGAPNVVLVLTDDIGFGNPAPFGGPMATPNFTPMAEGGLRYNRFHVTARPSGTRAWRRTSRPCPSSPGSSSAVTSRTCCRA